MKKALVLLGGLVATAAFAASNTVETTQQPMMRLDVFDLSSKVPALVEGRQYSISKNHQLCWTAFNMPFSAKNRTVEVFKSPAKSKFTDAIGAVVNSEDGKTHTITSSLESYNNEFIQRCWRFDKADPQGKYTVDIQVNDVTFPTQTFEVTK